MDVPLVNCVLTYHILENQHTILPTFVNTYSLKDTLQIVIGLFYEYSAILCDHVIRMLTHLIALIRPCLLKLQFPMFKVSSGKSRFFMLFLSWGYIFTPQPRVVKTLD